MNKAKNSQTILSSKANSWLSKANGNYTDQVEKPEEFLRFDLTEGKPWFDNKLEKWLKEIPIESVIHYPSANCRKHKKLLARWLHVKTENIALGNGSDEFIEFIPQIFLNPGDEVVVSVPSFFRFTDSSVKAGAKIRKVKFSENSGFEWDTETAKAFLDAAKRKSVKMIWLASPNNPTGVNIPEPILKKIIKTNKIVVLDKVLHGFTKELNNTARNIWKASNLIVISSFSKTFGLPGLRFGFAIASSEIVSIMHKWRLPFALSGPTLCLGRQLLESLINKEVVLEESNGFLKEKSRFERELSNIACIEIVTKSKTNFLLLKPTRNINLFLELKQRNILVTDLNETEGIKGKNFIRVTIKDKEQNDKLLSALKEINNLQ